MSAHDELLVVLAGDVMTGRGIDQAFARHDSPELYEPWVRDAREYLRLAEEANGPLPRPIDHDWVWGDALAELARVRPDVRIVNLETAITTADRPWPGKGIHYRMHPANVGLLARAGIDACVLANNHVMDWGREGLSETLAVLAGAGVRTAGAGADADAANAPAVHPLPGGGRLLVFAAATRSSGVPADWAATAAGPGVALVTLDDRSADALAARIAGHRRAGDRVVVSLHWGENWVARVPDAHRAFARRLVDAGAADVVHGHSSHHPLPIEVHRGKPILYGCGDLINDYEGIGPRGELRSDVGCLYFARLARQDGMLLDLRIVPYRLRRFRLSTPDADATGWLERLLTDGGRELGTSLLRDPDGGWRLAWQS
ncbi:CapA family protein [Burkholderiaceae bacterium FT117]|uniref:CapA family protein n=1 Tax=Zeimonas sediminis TaxID=2944268 RepID=UPI002342F36C|nr:CapA family protein [Zeimonas sediminis]MCM5571282.1 CapA family protein [Zeimonas sediminis]